MRIIVPSLGRAGTAPTMKWLPAVDREIVFAVHSDEIEAYRRAYAKNGIDFIELSDHCRKHTGLVRQEILQRYREPFIFVDDDIRIYLKTTVDIGAVFDQLEKHMDSGASMAGLGQQLFSNAQIDKSIIANGDPWVIRNKFVATVYGINPTHFDTCPLELLPVYEDIALVIHAIRYGGGTITTYMATHSNVSPPLGGCNAWRDKPLTLQSLENLVKLYPDVCSIRPTTNTTHSQHIGVGLRVAWSKIKKIEEAVR